MRLPVSKLTQGADVGRGVDAIVNHCRETMQPREFRDAMFVLGTLQRMASVSPALLAGEGADEKSVASLTDALTTRCAKEAANALGYQPQ